MTVHSSRSPIWWPIQFAGVAASVNIGKVPVALTVLRGDFGMSLLEAGFLVSMMQFAGMFLGLFGGVLADRFGPRRVMASGLVILAVAGIGGAFARSAGLLLLARALESAGFILTVLPGPALLRATLPVTRLTGALSLWSTYMPAGMTLALLLTPVLMTLSGWRVAWVVYAALALLAVGCLGRVESGSEDPRTSDTHPWLLARDTVCSAAPWVLFFGFGLYSGQFIAVFGFLPTMLQGAGVDAAWAGTLTAVGVLVNLCGNLAAGPLVRRFSPALLLGSVSLAMAILGYLLFTLEPIERQLVAGLGFSALGGIIPGVLFILAPRFAPHPRAVATTTGLMQQGSALGQFAAPPLVAWVAGTAHGWHHAWWVTSTMALADGAMALLMLRVVRRRRF